MGSKVLQLGHTFFSFEKGVSVGYNGFLFPRLYLHTQVYFVYEKYLGKVGRLEKRGVWKSGKPESGIGTGIGTGTGTGTGTGEGTGMGRKTYIKTGTTFTLI